MNDSLERKIMYKIVTLNWYIPFLWKGYEGRGGSCGKHNTGRHLQWFSYCRPFPVFFKWAFFPDFSPSCLFPSFYFDLRLLEVCRRPSLTKCYDKQSFHKLPHKSNLKTKKEVRFCITMLTLQWSACTVSHGRTGNLLNRNKPKKLLRERRILTIAAVRETTVININHYTWVIICMVFEYGNCYLY